MVTADSQKEISAKFEEEFKKIEQEVKRPNILIVGCTGVGKSTIVNQIFGEGTAPVGAGQPVTRGIHKIETPGKPINLFDTEGFEIGADEKFQNTILNFVKENINKPVEEQIHLIWHVISASSARITDYDKDLHQKLQGYGIPVALIFSKCDEVNEEDLEAMVKAMDNRLNFKIAYSSTESPFFTTDKKEFLEAEENLNLSKVVDWSSRNLSKSLELAFISAQLINIDAKRRKADSIILQHTTGNAFVGMSPIPFSDAPVLIASQAGMIARILYAYDFSNYQDIAKNFMATSGASLVISNLGRSLAGNLIKLIPGIGTVLGGMINAAVASVITYAMGKATSELMFRLNKQILNGDTTKANNLLENFDTIFAELFKEFFKKKSNNNGGI
ncbi:50S ribosome-binding GTPase [Salinimicrobium sp. MT39]|uniref:50S ribosome-binding GTPase n=1 Tax=Salinimicrobium profundisediminis TaxID=2994553 RepID=A0A9X3I1H3_9FLAO|nr:GTPase [Salinimicrobium profundisediminis]MCX2838594.1 50S ribosome-binding GTPase [Salinimicrobium profundisediminis]